MRREYSIILFLIWIGTGTPSFADTYARQPSIDVAHYDVSIQVNDTSNAITGSTKLRVFIRTEFATGMWLDFEGMSVDKLLVRGMVRQFTIHDGRLAFEFDRTYVRNESVEIEVRYHGKPDEGLRFSKTKYGRRVVFAENWPDRAHHWFPSIDHPSDKATVSFTVTTPDRYTVIANGTQNKSVLLPNKRKITQWTEANAIPTYCMVVAIGEFSILSSEKDLLPLAWYVYPPDSEKASVKFRRTAQILTYYENLLGPYPYDKLAQVESTIRLGAMENSNAIFYSETLFDSLSEEPVAHEIAHQWFGDSVTESDWDHLWLSEGFATYLEALFYEHVNGPASMKQRMDWYTTKIISYRRSLDRPVIDPSQTDLMKKLTPLTYEKGAWVLHMLRGMLGDKVFFSGLRRFYEQHAGSNISTADFQKAMELAGDTDLSTFFQQWLYKPGWPEYRVSWQWDPLTSAVEISVHQTQSCGLFDMPAEIRISAGDRRAVQMVRIHEAGQVFRVPFPVKPAAVEFDPDNHILKAIIP